MPPEKRRQVKSTIEEILISGKEIKYEASHSQTDNSVKWFYISMHPVFSEDKKVLGLSVAATDITGRKKTEVRIKQSNERYELVTKATKDVIWDCNFASNKIYRSEKYKHVFGYSNFKNNIYSESWVDNIHHEDREMVQQSIIKKVNDPAAILWEEEYRYYKANGEIAYVKDRGYIIRDE